MIHPAVLADMIRQSRDRDRHEAPRVVELARLPEPRQPVDPAEEVAGIPAGAAS